MARAMMSDVARLRLAASRIQPVSRMMPGRNGHRDDASPKVDAIRIAMK